MTGLTISIISHHAAQIPEIVTTMLACTRIGAPHRSVGPTVHFEIDHHAFKGASDVLIVSYPCSNPFSVVFAGFSAEAVRDRVKDAHSKWVFTADEGKRGGKSIPLKQIVDKALEQ